MQLHYLGKNVSVIGEMPLNDGYSYNATEDSIRELKHLLQNKNSKYLMAITSNRYQKNNLEFLKDNNFEEKVLFYSSHGDNETLTLWLKTNKKVTKSKKPATSLPHPNCSVIYSCDMSSLYGKRICHITLKKDSKDLLPNGFRQLEKTPIWFYIQDGKLVDINGKTKNNKKVDNGYENFEFKDLEVIKFI